MALFKDKPHNIPSDAVQLSEKEALEYQLKLLMKWEDKSDVFALKCGIPVLAVATTLTGIYMNRYYRRKYKLGNYGTIATYLPTCVIPTAMSALFHLNFIVPDVVLFKRNCPVCIEMKAATAQVFCGTILPLFLGNLGCLGLASKYSTFNIPYITEEPLKVLKTIQSISKPLVNILIAIFIGHALLASTVTYFEGKSVITVQQKLLADQKL